MAEKPMHLKSPDELAELGWRHARFKDGYAVTVAGNLDATDLADFKWLASEMGEEYVHLEALPSFKAPWIDRYFVRSEGGEG